MNVPVNQMGAGQPAGQADVTLAVDGQARAESGVVDQPTQEEQECVKKALATLKSEREFDKNARKEYAFCRRYARGDSSFTTSVNLLGTYIDILVAFLYARDPDVDVLVADSVGKQRLEDVRLFAKTLEIVVSRLWRQGKMKRQAKRWVRAALTVGIGWLKVGWQERYESDPVMVNRRRDIQDNLAKIAQMQRDAIAGEGGETAEELQYKLNLELKGVEAQIEKLVYRGLFIDFVPSEDIQVSLNVQNVVDCDVADRIAHRFFMPLDKAKAKYKRVPANRWSAVSKYRAVQPTDIKERTGLAASAAINGDVDSEDAADQFVSYQQGATTTDATTFLCAWEIWNQELNQVYTVAEGLDMYLAEPDVPNATTTRFHPFFPVAFNEVDGNRHPQSLIARSYQVMDDYNRARSAKSMMRARSKPGIVFDARKLSRKETEKITGSTYSENIPLKPTGDAKLSETFSEKPIPVIDPILLDVEDLRRELETLWGIQEALSAGVTVAKTATEAEIQQTGTQARTGAMRDSEESVLAEIAVYTSEIALNKLDLEDVQLIAGPEAFWPEDIGPEDFDLLVNVEIRAGSTGKPDTTRQREQWANEMPVLREAILEIARLRNANPLDTANCLEALVQETFDRMGDRMDSSLFLPKQGNPIPLVDPNTGAVVLAFPSDQQPAAAPGAGGGGAAPVPVTADATPTAAEAGAPAALPPQLTEEPAP